MKFVKPSCRARRRAKCSTGERHNLRREAGVLCIDGGSDFLDALAVFSAMVLIFGIGLGFGVWVRGP
jgi:hypothetical protein